MAYDAFCALCGAVASKPFNYVEEEQSYDPAVLQDEEMNWMGDIVFVGMNPDSQNLDSAFISGRAKPFPESDYIVQPGDDPNFPGPETIDYGSDNSETVITPYHVDKIPVSYPCHEICLFKVLPMKIQIAEGSSEIRKSLEEVVDKSCLYAALCSFAPNQEFGQKLELDYGDIDQFQDQFWRCERGYEAFASEPFTEPALQSYYGNLPRLQQNSASGWKNAREPEKNGHTSEGVASDPFGKLPLELRTEILLYCPINTANCLFVASASMRAVLISNPNSYWRSRLTIDMPWLFDFPAPVDAPADSIDYVKVYKDLRTRSRLKSEGEIHSLVNRRRIFETCEPIVEEYLAHRAESKSKSENSRSDAFHNAVSSGIRQVSNFKTKGFRTIFLPLASAWEDVSTNTLAVRFFWNSSGGLAGMGAATGNARHSSLGGSEEFSRIVKKVDDAEIEPGNWICGFIFTLGETKGIEQEETYAVIGVEVLTLVETRQPIRFGCQSGDKRLFHVSNGRLLVGISGQQTEPLITKLSLTESAPSSASKLNPVLSSLINKQNSSSCNSTEISRHLWKYQLPPSELTFGPLEYGGSYRPNEATPMECLSIGTIEEDFNAVTGIAADTHLGGFQILYSDGRPRKKISPVHQAMNVFRISGGRGERITYMAAFIGHLQRGIYVLTNWGRQNVFGHDAGGWDLNSLGHAPKGERLAGFYCSWKDYIPRDHKPRPQLSSFGLVGAPLSAPKHEIFNQEDPSRPSHRPERSRDEMGRDWTPGAPPPICAEATGPVMGNHDQSIATCDKTHCQTCGGYRLSPCAEPMVSFLDFSSIQQRPVRRIKIWLFHIYKPSQNVLKTQFSSVVLHYADGSVEAVGPSEFDIMEDGQGGDALTCACPIYNKEDEANWLGIPHYRCESWDLPLAPENGGEQPVPLQGVNVWAGVHLDGLQFVAAGGVEGPKVGLCKEEPTARFIFDAVTDGRATNGTSAEPNFQGATATRPELCHVTGVKFFLIPIFRPVTREDVVIMGVQGLIPLPSSAGEERNFAAADIMQE